MRTRAKGKVKKSGKIAIAGILALALISAFGLQLFAADKIVDTVMPAAGISVNAFRSNVAGANEVADLTPVKFSIKNAASGTMKGKEEVPILYVRNPVSTSGDKDFMVFSMDGNLEIPARISEIFLESANFENTTELKTWLLKVMGNDAVISTGDVLIPAYTHPTEGVKPAVTWTSLVGEHGPITQMTWAGQGTLSPDDPDAVIPKGDEEVLEIFDMFQPVSFTATSCTFEDGYTLSADETETAEAVAQYYIDNPQGTEPPTGTITGTWIITLSKAMALRDSHYVTAMYGTDAKYNGVAWALNHSYPVLSMHDAYADAGASYTDLVNRFMASFNIDEATAMDYARLFTYGMTQYAIYYHTGYSEESATPGVRAVLGNKIAEGVPELTALYEYLTADRDYTGYATKTMNNEMKLTGAGTSSVVVNAETTAAKNDGWNYYGPFTLTSDLFSAGDIAVELSGFATTDPTTNAVITNTPKLATAKSATRHDTLNLRQGQAFYVAIDEDYSDEDVSGIQLNYSYEDGTAEGASKSRMFHHVPNPNAGANAPDYAPLAVGATTVPAEDAGELNMPTFEVVSGRALTFTATGENNSPLAGVEITIEDAEGNEVASGTTNDQGSYTPAITFDFDTTYTYYETVVPAGYALNTTEYSVTVGPDNNPENIPNEKTHVTIRKLRADDRTTPMPGATIALYAAADTTTVLEYLDNDAEGRFDKIGLPVGDYVYREMLVSGTGDDKTYEPVGSIYEFSIAVDGTPSGDLIFYGGDGEQPGRATIRVVDDIGNPIPGSTVVVYPAGEEDEPIGTFTTNAQGYINTGELKPGDYRYKQTSVPDGYKLNETVRSFEVEKDGTIDPAPADIVSARIFRTVTIRSYDTVTNVAVPSVTFQVYPVGDTNSATTYTTGTNGTKSFDLPYGEYAFAQKDAVTGYNTNTMRYYFKVAASVTGDTELPLTPTSAGGNTGDQPLPPSSTGSFSVIAGDTNAGLPGVVVRVYNSAGAVVYEGTTDANGKITLPDTLAAGTYTYKMISAPSGYAVNPNTYTFTKSTDGIYTGLQNITASVVNVSIKKVDASNTAKALSGATLTLYSSTGTALDTKVTGSDGLVAFTKLAYGSYYIKETAAPSGYTLSSEIISFTIDATYVNKEATLLKNSATVQTGAELMIIYGIIFALGVAGAGYMFYRKRQASN